MQIVHHQQNKVDDEDDIYYSKFVNAIRSKTKQYNILKPCSLTKIEKYNVYEIFVYEKSEIQL